MPSILSWMHFIYQTIRYIISCVSDPQMNVGRARFNITNNYIIRVQLLSDIGFLLPVLIEADAKADAGWPVYLYMMDYVNGLPKYVPINGKSFISRIISHQYLQFIIYYPQSLLLILLPCLYLFPLSIFIVMKYQTIAIENNFHHNS